MPNKAAVIAAGALLATFIAGSLRSHAHAEASLRRRLADSPLADSSATPNISLTTVRLASETSVAQEDGSQQGVVEVQRDGSWGPVCKFGSLEAAVVCRQLGHYGAAYASYSTSAPTGSGPVLMKGVDCAGTEAALQSCTHAAVNASSCGDGYAVVTCSPNEKRQANNSVGVIAAPDSDLPAGQTQGALVLFRHGIWGAVCRDGLGPAEAAVACRELGYTGVATTDYSSSLSLLTWATNFTCNGTESRLADCQHADQAAAACPRGYATLTCADAEGGEPEMPIRLTGSKSCTSGRLEVYASGLWGQVCAVDNRAASVVCRQLGLSGDSRAVTSSYASSGNGQVVWVSNATCEGSEPSLGACKLNLTVAESCRDGYATVECAPPSDDWDPASMCTLPGPCQQLEGGNCSVASGHCVYPPKEEGANCSSASVAQGVCDGRGTCVSPDQLPSLAKYNASFGLPFPYLDAACFQNGSCFAGFDGAGAADAHGDSLFALVSVPQIGLSMVYAKDGVRQLVDIGKEANANITANISGALASVTDKLFARESFANLLLDDLAQYLAGGGGALGPRHRRLMGMLAAADWTNGQQQRRRQLRTIPGLPTPTLDLDQSQQVIAWFADWGALIADASTQAALAVAQATSDAADAVYKEAVATALKGAGLAVEAYEEVAGALMEAMPDEVLAVVDRFTSFKSQLDAAGKAKRQAMCGEWTKTHPGFYAGDVTLSACKDGKATLSGGSMGSHGGPVTQECRLEGEKTSVETLYESACMQKADDGAVFWGDGPSAPWIGVYVAGMLLGRMEEKAGLLLAPLAISGEELASYQQLLQSIDFETYADYNSLFWPAGMFHDWCYHHNPITYGKSKADCDAGLYETTMAVCAGGVDRWFKQAHTSGPSRDPATCRLVAFLYYLGVATRLPTDWAKEHIYDEPGKAWQAANTKVYYARPLSSAPGGQTTEGKDCRGLVPHCDLCYTPSGSDHPLCLSCASPYVADGKGDCVLVTSRINSLVSTSGGTGGCGSAYSYYQKFDVKCDFQCAPEKRDTGDWNLGCRCWDAACTRVVCELDTPQDDEQNPDVTWTCPVIASRASCGEYARLVAFLNSPDPLLSDSKSDTYAKWTPYSSTDGYECVLNTVRTLVETWSPACAGSDCQVPDVSSSAARSYVNYTDAGVQGELRVTRDNCYVYSGMDKDDVVTTSSGSRLLLPKGTQVDFVGPKFESQCDQWALVRLSWPPPPAATGSPAQPTFALAYMKEDCLVYDAKLNKCPNSGAAASQKPFSCATNAECCSLRCNCQPTVGGGMEAFDMAVQGATLPSGGQLMQRIRPDSYGASLFPKACCTE